MRLFHVSEESDIEVFNPRIPTRPDLDKNIGLVWAINEEKLPNFLTPRDCPRVGYHLNEMVDIKVKNDFFSSDKSNGVLIIEDVWFRKMLETTLYIYEFDSKDFYTR